MKNSELDQYFNSELNFSDILSRLRSIVLNCGLTEAQKWQAPCYTLEGKNICILGRFKDNCVLSFFKGAMLHDESGILVKAGENSQTGRIIRFRTLDDFTRVEPFLKAYIFEAIELERSGVKDVSDHKHVWEVPNEFNAVFAQDEPYKLAFEALTAGRQRAYAMFVAAAKNEQTRFDRVAKFRQRILDGYGMNDCTCGLSRRMPNCDGSHKQLNMLETE
jgi:uncharacterized protein YdeI (YjbR/CyaY-like superfamily)